MKNYAGADLGAVGLLLISLVSGAAYAAEHTVLVNPDNTFEPANLTIAVGDSVTWTNEGGLHNVNAPGFFRCANGCDGDGMGGSGAPATNDWSFTLTFDDEGTINYFCDVHIPEGMLGTLIVGEPTDLAVTAEGSCPAPGETEFVVSGATPNGEVAIVSGTTAGVSTAPAAAGACAGTELGIANGRLIGRVDADIIGRIVLPVEPGELLCGKLLQVMDLETCDVSEVATMPAADEAVIGLQFMEGTASISSPTDLRSPGDGTPWLFVTERLGLIKIWNGSTVEPIPFLDLRDKVETDDSNQGLLGMVFHPDYETNGHFFVHYTDLAGDTVVSRYSVSADDPMIADPDSEAVILQQAQPHFFHNGGPLNFGPDGYLYIALGDGGPIGDPDDRGQDLRSWLGKILRIDVDGAFPYAIPPDNPFVGVPDTREEIWAYGLRQPWRVSFDRITGDMYIGEVGNQLWEEVNVQPADSPGGVNYGWSLMEGPDCFDPPEGCESLDLHLPDLSYLHVDEDGFNGCAIIGGFVYRGPSVPEIDGRYLYADWCAGTIWVANRGPGGWTSEVAIYTGMKPTAWGEAEDTNLYVADESGMYRIVANPFRD